MRTHARTHTSSTVWRGAPREWLCVHMPGRSVRSAVTYIKPYRFGVFLIPLCVAVACWRFYDGPATHMRTNGKLRGEREETFTLSHIKALRPYVARGAEPPAAVSREH